MDYCSPPTRSDVSGELNSPHERLPWYTLERVLEKHGFDLVNWAAGVLRKCGNRVIHDLGAVEADILRSYYVSSRASTTSKPHTHGGTRFTQSPSKRTRFRDVTSKVMQQNEREWQVDGAPGI